MLKEIDAVGKNGFVLERDRQAIYKENASLMGVTGGVSGIAEIMGHPGKYQIIV